MARPKSLLWADHTWEEIAGIASQGAVVVAPFGSVEQHGPALPLETDMRIAEKVALDGAALASEQRGVPVLVLPTSPVGLAEHHLAFAGTLSLEPETFVAMVAEILGCVLRHGFRRVAVVSGHGGNDAGLELAIRKTVAHAGAPVRIARFAGWSDYEFAVRRDRLLEAQGPEQQPAIHASRPEVAQTLYDRPHLVVKDRLERPELRVQEVPDWCWLTEDLSESGAFGDPTLATPEHGRDLWQAWAEAFALFLLRLWRAELPD